MISQQPSFTTIIAETKEDLAALFHLRYGVYCGEMGSLDPQHYPLKEERDRYDAYAVHIITKHGDELIGTLRLVKDNPYGFVLEESFTLPAYIDRTKTVEHSRGVIKKEYRGYGIYSLMLEKAYEWQRENGFTVSIGAPNTNKLAAILLEKGWRPLGPPIENYHHTTIIPMLYDLTKS